jgi:putative addiction module component (TIGR02574 family)
MFRAPPAQWRPWWTLTTVPWRGAFQPEYGSTMSEQVRTLLEAALRLTASERAELAEELWRSTGPGRSLDDPAYLREVEQRAVAALAGRAAGRTWAEVKASLPTGTSRT